MTDPPITPTPYDPITHEQGEIMAQKDIRKVAVVGKLVKRDEETL